MTIAKLAERARPLTIDTLGATYVRQHRPGHGRFIETRLRDLEARKERANER